MTLQEEFIDFAIDAHVLSFGTFITKAHRISPYFFNAGLFNHGACLDKLAQFYARTLLASNIPFDMLFGPAYKGITLASATAVALTRLGRHVPFAYNRKEAKDHGEGGQLIGAPLQGKVVIIDDVISAGTSVRESIDLISAAGAEPCAVLVALDRMEKSGKDDALSLRSAAEEIFHTYHIPVIAIANLTDLFHYITNQKDSSFAQHKDAIAAYRDKYGVSHS